MRYSVTLLASAVILISIGSFGLYAQDNPKPIIEAPEGHRPALLILGSGHLRNPGRDLIQIQNDDVMTEKRQEEVVQLVEQLVAFKPTHVVVEVPPPCRMQLTVSTAPIERERRN